MNLVRSGLNTIVDLIFSSQETRHTIRGMVFVVAFARRIAALLTRMFPEC
jgi:hypothetical protein